MRKNLDGLQPALSADDIALFRQATRFVTPIRPSGRILLPPAPIAPRTLLRQRRQWASGSEPPSPPRSSLPESCATIRDDTRYVSAGRGPDLIHDLKRGKWPMQASLDLHGSTLDQAHARLNRFLASCADHGIRGVQIVHGKGLGSKNGTPVLKKSVRHWLTETDTVLAYVECAEADGGAGAVHALLRAPAKPPRH